MPLKTTADGSPLLLHGQPIWIDDQGHEAPVDLPRLLRDHHQLTTTAARLLQAETTLRQRDQQLHQLLLRSAFDNSPFLRDHTLLPPDIAYASFSHHFAIEDLNGLPTPVARLNDQIIPSPARPGQPASPDEALQHLLHLHPQRDRLLKAGHPGGSGGTGTRQPSPAPKPWAHMTLDEQARYIEQHGPAAAKTLIDQSA